MATLSHVFLIANFPEILLWTLFHSVWQAALLAIPAGLFLMATRRSRPELRYNGLLGLGLFILISSGLTFIYLWTESVDAAALTTSPQRFSIKMKTGVFHFITRYSSGILLVWLFVFLLKCLHLGTGFRRMQQIRRREIYVVDNHWEARFQALLQKLQMNTAVRLLQSRLLSVPATLGFFKPLVLVPVGLLTRFPPEQIEAILLHELAHIKRKDYLVNGIQKVVEALFFFNPFLLWISKRLTIERENCCDALAIRHVGDKDILARALVNFEEQRQGSLHFALNFNPGKGQLLHRVRRLVLHQNQTLNSFEKLVLAVSIFLFLGWLGPVSRMGTATYPLMPEASYESSTPRLIRTQIILQDVVIESMNMSATQDTLKVATAITEDLIRSGVIQNKSALSYTLNSTELVVNGVRQPARLHQQFKEKYIHEKGWSLLYTQREPGNKRVAELS